MYFTGNPPVYYLIKLATGLSSSESENALV
jgi:hypothetical protein